MDSPAMIAPLCARQLDDADIRTIVPVVQRGVNRGDRRPIRLLLMNW